MAGLRRAPQAKPAKPKVKAPIHQRILGRHQVELDLLDDLESELEQAYKFDQIEYDDYLDCWQSLEIRRAKAIAGKAKALGKPLQQKVEIKAKAVYKPKPLALWQKKLICVVVGFVLFKIFC